MYNRCQMKPVAQRERNVAMSFKSLECAGNIEVQLKVHERAMRLAILLVKMTNMVHSGTDRECLTTGDLRSFGIINANLAVDYTASEDCTWHMWRNALMEVSTVNLVRGQFLKLKSGRIWGAEMEELQMANRYLASSSSLPLQWL